MKCSWCGGEILETVVYEAPVTGSEYIEQIRQCMTQRFFCSNNCLKRNLQLTVSDLLPQTATRR